MRYLYYTRRWKRHGINFLVVCMDAYFFWILYTGRSCLDERIAVLSVSKLLSVRDLWTFQIWHFCSKMLSPSFQRLWFTCDPWTDVAQLCHVAYITATLVFYLLDGKDTWYMWYVIFTRFLIGLIFGTETVNILFRFWKFLWHQIFDLVSHCANFVLTYTYLFDEINTFFSRFPRTLFGKFWIKKFFREILWMKYKI